jgi:4-hydroxy-3-methylbut-2-en-1-yl diphosphate reductase
VDGVKRLVLVAPRGYCAGVERAVEVVEEALARWGRPIYVRKQIVHNMHVVCDLEGRGAIFVESEEDVPLGGRLVFSAHGVSPLVRERAAARGLNTIDATCPLVAKVHAEARHYAARDYSIILVGHAGHEEVEGTMGEAPEAVFLVESVEDAERVAPLETDRVVYLTQTTLSVDDAAAVIEVLRRRFPAIEAPRREDICYATTNRQRALKAILVEIDLLLVIGSRNSSNSNRLVEVAHARGVAAHLIDDESEIDERWLAKVESVGITSGASVPESLVQGVVAWFRLHGVEEIRSQTAVLENVSFRLPVELR